VENRSGKANRDDVVCPALRKFLHTGDHLSRRHPGSGDDFSFLLLSRGKYFDMTPTDVDGQDFHFARIFRSATFSQYRVLAGSLAGTIS
jgi:hypothetical protein